MFYNLSIAFITTFGHLAAVPWKEGQISRRALRCLQGSVHLPRIKRVFCQFRSGKAKPENDLQLVWVNQWNGQLVFY
jgi:hypothetical protein